MTEKLTVRGSDVSVVIVGFNRPAHTQALVRALSEVQPARIFAVCDGPRMDHPEDEVKCREVRRILTEDIRWPCTVVKNFSSTNMGCGRRVVTGLDWVFEQVEEAIILEDDCIPNPSFFRYCRELLALYRHDSRVVHIGGNNFQDGANRSESSYFFSRYNHIWGWATWRRAWRLFDHNMSDWPDVRNQEILRNVLIAPGEYEYWASHFDAMHAQRPSPRTWGYAWTYACFKNGVSVYPGVNLVSNIGFGESATHCKGSDPYQDLGARAMEFPLKHPPCIVPNLEADEYTVRHHFGIRDPTGRPVRSRIGSAARRLLSRARP